MIALVPDASSLDVLLIGAHPDDIEIGCGGTLLQMARRPGVTIRGAVLTGVPARQREAREALESFVPGSELNLFSLPDSRLPGHWDAVKDTLEGLSRTHAPDIVFAPRIDDAHQDHRLLGSLASTTWRNSLILHYEIPKWDGDLGRVSHYVRLSDEDAHRKVNLLNAAYPSQHDHDWWDDEMFLGLMRMRGMESRAPYAEGFMASKVTIDLG